MLASCDSWPCVQPSIALAPLSDRPRRSLPCKLHTTRGKVQMVQTDLHAISPLRNSRSCDIASHGSLGLVLRDISKVVEV